MPSNPFSPSFGGVAEHTDSFDDKAPRQSPSLSEKPLHRLSIQHGRAGSTGVESAPSPRKPQTLKPYLAPAVPSMRLNSGSEFDSSVLSQRELDSCRPQLGDWSSSEHAESDAEYSRVYNSSRRPVLHVVSEDEIGEIEALDSAFRAVSLDTKARRKPAGLDVSGSETGEGSQTHRQLRDRPTRLNTMPPIRDAVSQPPIPTSRDRNGPGAGCESEDALDYLQMDFKKDSSKRASQSNALPRGSMVSNGVRDATRTDTLVNLALTRRSSSRIEPNTLNPSPVNREKDFSDKRLSLVPGQLRRSHSQHLDTNKVSYRSRLDG
jgi:hypothetical protein